MLRGSVSVILSSPALVASTTQSTMPRSANVAEVLLPIWSVWFCRPILVVAPCAFDSRFHLGHRGSHRGGCGCHHFRSVADFLRGMRQVLGGFAVRGGGGFGVFARGFEGFKVCACTCS